MKNDDGIMDSNHWYLVNTWAPVDDIDPIDDPIIEPKEDDPDSLAYAIPRRRALIRGGDAPGNGGIPGKPQGG